MTEAACPALPASTCYSNRIDTAHTHVSAWVETGAKHLDHFLGGLFVNDDVQAAVEAAHSTNNSMVTSAAASYVVFSPGITYGKEDGTHLRGRFKAHINLPSLKDRVQLIFNNVQEDADALREITDPISRIHRVTGEDDKTAGLKLLLIKGMHFDLSLAGGLRFKPAPIPKIQTKARLSLREGATLYELVETGFWQSDNGFGEKTEAIATHAVGKRLTLRSNSAVVNQEEVPGVTLGQTLSAEYMLRPRRSLGLTLGIEWVTQPSAIVNRYSVRVPFRQGIWRDWLSLRIEPGCDFPNEDNFNADPLITVGLDIQFGAMPAVSH